MWLSGLWICTTTTVDNSEVRELIAPSKAGRLDAWLAEVLPVSRSRLKAMVVSGEIRVDGETTRPSRKLNGGECVTVPPVSSPTTLLTPQDIPLDILHLDAQVLVVNKPAGLVVHPAPGHPDGTLVNAVLHLLETREPDAVSSDSGARLRPGIVHRLDRGTSGVMVVARTPNAHAALAAQFAAHTTDRRYLALVHGESAETGTVNAPLGRSPRDRIRYTVVENGKHAVTHWRRLAIGYHGIAGNARGGRVSLIECKLETGRTHQIRVHMRHTGHPIVGDPLYAAKRKLPAAILSETEVNHQLLHAYELGFKHPETGTYMQFRSSPPEDYRRVLRELDIDFSLDSN